jgi:hypothetical protein
VGPYWGGELKPGLCSLAWKSVARGTQESIPFTITPRPISHHRTEPLCSHGPLLWVFALLFPQV